MFFASVCFEWRFYSRRFLWPAAALIFAGLGFAMTGRVGSGAPALLNAAYALFPVYQLLTLAAVVKIAALTGIAVLRDTNHDSEALVFSTGVSRTHFLAARFTGLLTVSFTVVSAAALGSMLRAVWPVGLDGDFAPVNPLLHLRLLLVVVLPNLVLIASVLFAVALRTRNAAATFVTGLILYALYLASANLIGSPFMSGEPPAADSRLQFCAALLDPLAITPFFQQTEHWTRPMRDSLFPAFSGLMLANRLLWLGITGLVWRHTLRTFELRMATSRAKRWRWPWPSSAPATPSAAQPAYRPLTPSRGFTVTLRAWCACVRLELGLLGRSIPFWLCLVVWCALLLGEITPITRADLFGAPRLPLTALVLKRFQFDLLPGFALFMMLFYSGEMGWREREHQVEALVATTAAGRRVTAAAKLTVLGLLPMILIGLAVLLGVGCQIHHGWYHFELGQYAALFLFGGVPLALWSLPCWLLQNLSPNKMIGTLAGAAACLLCYGGLCALLGFTHPLWRFGVIPNYSFSAMNGYHDLYRVFAWYLVYWCALGAAMFFLAEAVQRGAGDQPLAARLRALIATPRLRASSPLILSALTALGLAAAIGYQTHAAGGDRTPADSQQQRAGYERRFAGFRGQAQPKIAAVATDLQLFPRQQRYVAQGRYQLRNHHDHAIDEMLVTLNPNLPLSALNVAGATRVTGDAGGVVFRFAPALAAGAETDLTFTIDFRGHGFGPPAARHSVRANGSVLHSNGWFPTIGYVTAVELQRPEQRAQWGLDPAPPATSAARDETNAHDDFVAFQTRITTSADQIALAPGHLIAHGRDPGRRWFQYRANGPIRNAIVYLSADYRPIAQESNGVNLALYAAAGRPNNSARLIHAAAATLDYGRRHFGAAPPSELRIAAVPTTSGISGYAAPGLVLIGEHSGFEEGPGQAGPGLAGPGLAGSGNNGPENAGAMSDGMRRTIHEVAHQWWGLQLAPADDDLGGMLFVESLAKYTELMVMEQIAGPEVLARYLDREQARYFRERRRATEPEVALTRMHAAQRYLTYAKAGAAFVALRNRLGQVTLNRALQSLLENHAYPGRPPTPADLILALETAAPEQTAFIREWLTTVTVYRSTVAHCEIEPRGEGNVRLSIDLELEKWRGGESGAEVTEPFTNELVWAVTLADGTVQRQRTTLHAGLNHLSMDLPSRPTAICIDPERALLDEHRERTQRALRALLSR